MNTKIDVNEIKKDLMLKGYTEYECQKKTEEIVNSIHEYANKITAEKEEKAAIYQQCMEMESQRKNAVSVFQEQYSTNPAYKDKYEQALAQYSDAEIDTKIARNSYNHAISFAGKMNTQSIIASSIFAA